VTTETTAAIDNAAINSEATVMTVTGPVKASDLGVVLPHEHVFVNVMREYRGSGMLHDPAVALEELTDFRRHGGGTLVELTLPGLGRDPLALAKVSRASGVHIVMGCGHYREPYLDLEHFATSSIDDLATEITTEIESGVDATGVRPGIIGEIGSNEDTISTAEEKSLRAAARAHLATGLTISTHAAWFPVGIHQLDILEDEGVPPRRVIIGHSDGVPGPEYQLELARRGCYVELDGFGTDTDYDSDRAVDLLIQLRENGHRAQVLVSQDVFLRTHVRARGGPGYTWIARELVPRLHSRGLTKDETRQLLVDNPRDALTGHAA
jgi:predicted metal-dependent phosphotriesterase family hydrolase